MTNTKVVDIDEFYNFVVDNFLFKIIYYTLFTNGYISQ